MRKFLADHRDWWLPILTTFLGVFLAAYATIAIDKSKSSSTAKKLLKVSLEDTCASWITAESALGNTKKHKLRSYFSVVSPPNITTNLFRQNPVILGDFHPLIAGALVRRLVQLEMIIDNYNYSAEQVRALRVFKLRDNQDSLEFLDRELRNREEDALGLLILLEDDLVRIAYMLWLELQLRTGMHSRHEVPDLMENQNSDSPCKSLIEARWTPPNYMQPKS